MLTCRCPQPREVGVKPSGLVYCKACGGALPLQPPPKKERP